MDRVSLADRLRRTKDRGVLVLHSDQDRLYLHQVRSALDRLCPLRLARVRLYPNSHSALVKFFPAA